jgi:hypothetical protein
LLLTNEAQPRPTSTPRALISIVALEVDPANLDALIRGSADFSRRYKPVTDLTSAVYTAGPLTWDSWS